MPRKKSRRRSRRKSKGKEKYLLCPYCNAEYTSSKQVISLWPGWFTSKQRRIYGCYNCKKIFGVGSRSSTGLHD